jgi:glycosyltransferase involved in cell wall biosynthesis
MKICLVGDFSANLDEGFKNTGHYLSQALALRHQVEQVNIKNIRQLDFWRHLLGLKPDVVHILAQPTSQSFAFAYLLKRRWPRVPTLLSALRPERFFSTGLSAFQKQLVRWSQPDLVVVQSAAAESQFDALACKVARLPNGVDLNKFKPASPEEKSRLKAKYQLSPQPVVLHVGHLEPDRNLLALAALPAAGFQVVVAGSLYMGTHAGLIDDLEQRGYHLLKGYQPNIADIYRLADCYVFPPPPGNSLAMPLSVLEAMACNLPVVTTRFSGLLEAFPESSGLRFVESQESFLPAIREVLNAAPTTRDMVTAFSWPAVAERLEQYYQDLL